MISIVIPTYDEEFHLPQLLDRILEGKPPSHEIIIVDGHSRDKTKKIASKYNCRVFTRTRKGISDARNFGVTKARGDIVAFLDADSLPCVNWLEIIEENFKDKKINGIGGPTNYNNPFYDIFTGLIFLTNPITKHFGFLYFSANNSAYRRDFFETYCGFKEILGEDIELSWRLNKFYPTFRFIDKLNTQLSSRRFEKKGFFRTLIHWCTGDILIFLGRGFRPKNYSDILR